MRQVYEVYIIDPETDDWWKLAPVIAMDEDSAKVKAFLKAKTSENPKLHKDVDDYDVIMVRLGEIRAKVAKTLNMAGGNAGQIIIGNS